MDLSETFFASAKQALTRSLSDLGNVTLCLLVYAHRPYPCNYQLALMLHLGTNSMEAVTSGSDVSHGAGKSAEVQVTPPSGASTAPGTSAAAAEVNLAMSVVIFYPLLCVSVSVVACTVG